MMTEKIFRRAIERSYGEIVTKDCYLLQQWKSDFFDYVVDIGANVGVFVNYVHMRHPKARIFAYEPCKETFNYVIRNQFIPNVIYNNEALGDGSLLFFGDTGYSGCNQFFKREERNLDSYSVKSLSLGDIFRQNDISLSSNYFIKIDCEGGERFLLDDNEAISIIKQSCGFAMEVHFPPRGKNLRQGNIERFGTFPVWEIYNNWINDNFSESHKIVYHCSSGARGAGVYVLMRKDQI